jgi:hypothetical protein
LKNILFIVLVLIGYTGIGQVDLNDYKYIIVPKTLGDFKEQNQYLTSTLLKHEFIKNGFVAVYDDALPEDLYMDRCLGLTAILKDNSSMFGTKVKIALQNCRKQEVFSSIEGTNKIKEYKEAYKKAIIKAMSSYKDLNYSYREKKIDQEPITISFKNDIKNLDSEVSNEVNDLKSENKSKVIKQTSTLEDQSFKSMEPVASNIKQAPPNRAVESASSPVGTREMILYAQPIANGYELLDSSSNLTMKLLNSSTENMFIGQANDKSGMVFLKEGIWIFEYYLGADLVQEELKIKF